LPPNAPAELDVGTLESDEELVARCREQRDEAAFAELVRRYRDRVFRLAVSILGQGFVGEAEEVTQEVMLRVYHSLASFRG
jgi:RNA polymerase sigma-70 factor, ECF subfamily